jgi:hypothetical protein
MQDVAFLEACSWQVMEKEKRPNLQHSERVMIKAYVERGLSMPPSKFFTEVLRLFRSSPATCSLIVFVDLAVMLPSRNGTSTTSRG